MATWTSLGSTTLLDGAGNNLGSVQFEYDSSSTGGSTWPFRLRVVARSGYTFSVDFRSIVVGGVNYGTVSGVTQSSGTIVTGNVSPGSRSATWTCPWYNGSRSYSITGTLPAKGSAPSDISITETGTTWNSITATVAIGNWGGGSVKNFELKILNQAYVGGVSALQEAASGDSASITVTNNSTQYTGTIDTVPTLKGCGEYHMGVYANNGSQATRYQGGTVYLPPAPVVFNYVRVGETNQWQVTMTGDPNNNVTTYTANQLTRSLRYKIDNGSWTNVESAVVKAIDATTIFTVTVPAQSTATFEGWMTYQQKNSETSTFTIANTDAAVHLYGSVNNQSKEIHHLYGSVNGRSKKITKLYASVGGVAKLIFEDS